VLGLFHATGHEGAGIGLAPATADLVTALINGTAPVVDAAPVDGAPVDGAPFAPARFAAQRGTPGAFPQVSAWREDRS
jgi:glycine/D-amino acid oxidase-like deaminating enzyme